MLGVTGFLSGDAAGSLYRDPETARWSAFFFEWWKAHGGREVQGKDLLEQAVRAEILAGGSSPGAARSLGKQLSKYRDRVFGPHRLCQRTGAGAIMLYSLRELPTEPEAVGSVQKAFKHL